MFVFRKTLLLLVLCVGLGACQQKTEQRTEQRTEPSAPQATLTAEQQALALQQMQQALLLQQLQLQQQVYTQTFNTVQAHEQKMDQHLKNFSATQACAIAGNCRVETQIVPAQ